MSRQFTNFDAGKNGRRLKSIPTTVEAINSQIRKYGKNVLARSRYLCANNAYASAAKEAFVASLVGSGIKPSSLLKGNPELKEEIQLAWYDWTDEADADWNSDFYGLQALVAAELFEAGEVFIRMRKRRTEDGLIVPLQLQVLPSEMLPLNNWEVNAAGTNRRIECGVEFDGIGKRTAYHFLRQHPGELLQFQPSSREIVVVPADEVLHIYRPMRAGQIRGVPHSLSGLAPLAMLDLYDDAELERKRTTALYAGFVRKNGSDGHPFEGAEDGQQDLFGPELEGPGYTLEPGAMVDLEPGEEVQFSQPADVGGNYEAFEYRNLLRVATGLGVPYADMTGDLRQTSYASLRAGLLQFRRRIGMMQHHVMVYQLCRPVWRFWFELAVINGAISIGLSDFLRDRRNYQRVKWIPPRWEWIDPEKDRRAEKIAVDNGWKSRDDVIEEEGYDPEEVDERIKSSQDRAAALKFGVAASLGANIPAPAEPSPDGPDPDADERPTEEDTEGSGGETRRSPDDLKAVVDVYGVSVRSGSITPQVEDEEYFRNELGIPAMSENAKAAWERDKTRRPVTLTTVALDNAENDLPDDNSDTTNPPEPTTEGDD
jgi:lambda family phage portal protein